MGVLIVGSLFYGSLNSALDVVNIDYETGYEEIDVIQITKYSDGFQVITTTGKVTYLGLPVGENITYADPNCLITGLGKHKIRTGEENCQEITSVISIIGIINSSDFSQENNDE